MAESNPLKPRRSPLAKLLPARRRRERLFFASTWPRPRGRCNTIYLGDLPRARASRLGVQPTGGGTLDVGFRSKATGTVIDVDGIAALARLRPLVKWR
jgi:hypothetical protein